MVTKLKKHRQAEATDLLEKAQKDDDIFGKTARSISHWMDKYGDYSDGLASRDSLPSGKLGGVSRGVHCRQDSQSRDGHCHR